MLSPLQIPQSSYVNLSPNPDKLQDTGFFIDIPQLSFKARLGVVGTLGTLTSATAGELELTSVVVPMIVFPITPTAEIT